MSVIACFVHPPPPSSTIYHRSVVPAQLNASSFGPPEGMSELRCSSRPLRAEYATNQPRVRPQVTTTSPKCTIRTNPTCSHSPTIAVLSESSTDIMVPWRWTPLSTCKVRSTLDTVCRSYGSWLQQDSVCSHSSSTNPCEGLLDGHSGRAHNSIRNTIADFI